MPAGRVVLWVESGMGKIPDELRETIARNIRECRMKKYPGRGGGKKCAGAFGVSPQQWSPWERGLRTPDEVRLTQIAGFFGVTVEYLRRDNRLKQEQESSGQVEPPPLMPGGGSFDFTTPHVAYPSGNPDSRNGKDTVHVPVFVLLPYLPDDMKALYEQFTAAMNGGQATRQPP